MAEGDGAGNKVNLSQATHDELRSLCKKQNSHVKALNERVRAVQAELDKGAKRTEEQDVKIEALNAALQSAVAEAANKEKECEERIAEVRAESEKKLEVWKARAKAKIQQLESELATKGGGGSKGEGDVSELTAALKRVSELQEALTVEKERSAAAQRQFEEEKSAFTDTQTALLKSLEEAREQLAQSKHSVAKDDDNIVALQQKLESSHHAAEVLQREAAKNAAVIEELMVRVKESEGQTRRLQVELEEAAAEHSAELRLLRESKEEELKALQAAVISTPNAPGSPSGAAPEALQAELDSSHELCRTVQQQLEEAQREARALKEELEAEKEGKQALAKQLAEQKKEVESLKATVEDLSFFESMGGGKAQLEEARAAAEKSEAALREEVQGRKVAEAALETARRDLTEAKAALQAASDESRQLRDALSEAKAELERVVASAARSNTAEVDELRDAAEQLRQELEAARSEGRDYEQRFKVFRAKAKEIHDTNTEQVAKANAAATEARNEADDLRSQLSQLRQEFDLHQKKSLETIKRKAQEMTALRSSSSTAESELQGLREEISQLKDMLDAKEAETLDAQQMAAQCQRDLEVCRNALVQETEQLRTLFEEERMEWVKQKEIDVQNLRDMLESQQQEENKQQTRDSMEKEQRQHELLEQARRELKSVKEASQKLALDKDREIARLSMQVANLQRAAEEAKASTPPSSSGPSPLSANSPGGEKEEGRAFTAPTQRTDSDASTRGMAAFELGRDMMLLAQQQASRDVELQQYRREIRDLQQKVAALSSENQQLIKSRKEKPAPAAATAAAASPSDLNAPNNMDYLRNIVVKFLCEKNKTVQSNLLPVIATVLQLTSADKALIKQAYPSVKAL